ncbi:MAG: hypothetical protein HS128_12415 [Ideonella sp.]|nr:hypothetical protein [Ideonella sp.]
MVGDRAAVLDVEGVDGSDHLPQAGGDRQTIECARVEDLAVRNARIDDAEELEQLRADVGHIHRETGRVVRIGRSHHRIVLGGKRLGQEAPQAVAADGQLFVGSELAGTDKPLIERLQRLVLSHAQGRAQQRDIDHIDSEVDAPVAGFGAADAEHLLTGCAAAGIDALEQDRREAVADVGLVENGPLLVEPCSLALGHAGNLVSRTVGATAEYQALRVACERSLGIGQVVVDCRHVSLLS